MNYEKINAEAIKACVKCGFIPIDTPPHSMRYNPSRPSDNKIYEILESMTFTCWRCGYEWEIGLED